MVDLSEREMISKSADEKSLKTCVDCGTSKTPLWRGGPAGPKSLCNACGIRSRKKRRAIMCMGVTKEEKKIKKSFSSGKNSSHESSSSNSSTSSSGDCRSNLEDLLKNNKDGLWAFGRDVAFQRPRSNTTQRRKMGEVERAAVLLMALSCGSAYA